MAGDPRHDSPEPPGSQAQDQKTRPIDMRFDHPHRIPLLDDGAYRDPLDCGFVLESGGSPRCLIASLIACDEQGRDHGNCSQGETGVGPQIDGGPGGSPPCGGVAGGHDNSPVPGRPAGEQDGTAAARRGAAHHADPMAADCTTLPLSRHHHETHRTVEGPSEHRNIRTARDRPSPDRQIPNPGDDCLDQTLHPGAPGVVLADLMDQGHRLGCAGGRQSKRLGNGATEIALVVESHTHAGPEIGREPGDPGCEGPDVKAATIAG